MKHSRVRAKRSRVRRQEAAAAVIRCVAFLVVLAGCVLAVQWARDGFHRSIVLDNPSPGPSLTILAGLPSGQIQPRNRRLVYPYSVVPGGVRSAGELRDAAAHDPVVAAHYAGFDFRRARVIELQQPQLVYLSYRRGQHIYWTRKQASLHKGEKLLSDGRMTARTRCGNQVSALPKAETGPDEPTMAELDRPDSLASGIDRTIPSAFNSNLLNVDPALPLRPSMPGGGPIGGGTGGFLPPPIGGGGGGIGPPTGGNCPPKSAAKSCNSQPPPTPPPPPPPPAPVPEPTTFVLMLSGAAAVFSRLRLNRS